MSPTSYQTAPPRISIIANAGDIVKLARSISTTHIPSPPEHGRLPVSSERFVGNHRIRGLHPGIEELLSWLEVSLQGCEHALESGACSHRCPGFTEFEKGVLLLYSSVLIRQFVRIMPTSIEEILASYDERAPLSRASTIPAAWYTDPRIADLERQNVIGKTWQMVARSEQLQTAGQFISTTVAGEPIVVVRDNDGILRAFYNVCRHHAAAVVTQPCGRASLLRCPYHGWNYGLDGSLKGTPEFEGVENFDRSQNGLVPVRVETWECFVFINLDIQTMPLTDFLGGLIARVAPLGISDLHYFDRRTYDLHCNWKVYVDNFLDGGYHVPHLHKGLNSVLDYKQYTIENEDRYCLQSSPMVSSGEDAATGATRKGDRAWYFWQYPNLMINCYEGYMDTNLVIPIDTDHCRVIFDFYFADVSEKCRAYNEQSVNVGNRVQEEDLGICEDVQRGLKSRAYQAGRLSVRREAGEHLFHRLLAADLRLGS
jgi:choline monooxygenase